VSALSQSAALSPSAGKLDSSLSVQTCMRWRLVEPSSIANLDREREQNCLVGYDRELEFPWRHNEDRADRASDGKRSPTALWRHRADRLLFDRRTGGSWPRRDAVCQRRFDYGGQSRFLRAQGIAA